MSNQTLNRMLDDFYPYAKEYLGFDKDAKISFASDKNNASKPLGKTAYYDPSNYSVTVYTDNRHPKDIMRSVSHELVHHAQNLRGDLNMSEDTGEGYAQNDEHLREMEREAYEKGNLCFRDWEDGIKSNLEPGTIYESRARRSKKSMNNFKTLNENFKSFLQQENEAGSYQAGDKVKDLRNDTVGTVVEPMAGGAVIELEDGTIVKTRDKFLEKVEGEPMQEGGSMAEYGKIDAEDGNPPSKIGRGNPEYMEAYNAVLIARGEEPLDIQQPDQAYLDALRSGRLEEGDGQPKQGDDVVVTAGGLAGAAGEVMELTTSTQGEPAVVIYLRKDADQRVMGQAGDEVIALVSDVQVDRGIQGDDSVEPEDDYNWVGHKAHYQEGTDVTEEYNGQLWENKIDKIVDMVMKEYGDHETQAQGGMVSSTQSSDPEMDQVADIAATVAEQGGALMQIATALKDQGFDASLQAGVLMIDNKYFIGKPSKFDIGPDEPVQEVGPYVVGMMDNQMEEGMADKTYTYDGGGDAVYFAQDLGFEYEDEDEEDFDELEGMAIDFIKSKGYEVVGYDDDFMQEGESRHNTPDFFGSDDEKEMMKKMSNKEFYDYVTRDRHTRPNLKDEPSMGGGGPIDGMEGPFQYKSGAVLYYDPKEGKYYDRSRDQYLDNEEAAKLTMENTQMKLKNVSLREKVKNSVMSKLKEMYDDDDMYGDEDPYMASLEAEFPWMKDDKKGGKMSKADLAAMQAAEKDAQMDPDMMAQMQAGLDDMAGTSEDDDDPVVTMKEDDVDFAEALRTRVLNRIQEMSLSEEEQESTEKHDDDPALKGDQDELPDELQAAIIDKADDEGEKKEESLRDKVYRIVQETLNEEEHEDDEKEEVEEGKYKREDEDDKEDVEEGKMKYSREDDEDKEEVEEGKYKRKDDEDKEEVEEAKHDDEDKEDVEENIAANPEDFFRKLRNESRTIKQDNWNDSHRSKRSSMLNERLMKSWFNK